MSLYDIQKQVDEWVKQYKIEYFQPLSIMTQICEEVGELAREVNNLYGDRAKKAGEDTKDLGDEIADVIFACVCMANRHKIDLDQSFERLMAKRYGRDNDRYEKKQIN